MSSITSVVHVGRARDRRGEREHARADAVPRWRCGAAPVQRRDDQAGLAVESWPSGSGAASARRPTRVSRPRPGAARLAARREKQLAARGGVARVPARAQRDLDASVAVDVVRGDGDVVPWHGAVHDDVPLPDGVLEPRQLRRVDRHDVGPAVGVDVGDPNRVDHAPVLLDIDRPEHDVGGGGSWRLHAPPADSRPESLDHVGWAGDITKLRSAGIESRVTMVIERERYLDDSAGPADLAGRPQPFSRDAQPAHGAHRRGTHGGGRCHRAGARRDRARCCAPSWRSAPNEGVVDRSSRAWRSWSIGRIRSPAPARCCCRWPMPACAART